MCAEKGRAQHNAANAVRIRLRIGQRKRRAPGAADQDPARKAESFADYFHVRDQVLQRVGLAAALGAAFACATLIEQDGTKALGIEQPPVIRLAAASGTTMQINCGNAIGAADTLDIDV